MSLCAGTQAAKHLSARNRLILSGAPIQNRLTELWSLMDFVYPGKLGSQKVFEAQYARPISIGGYRHATTMQQHYAYQCALALRDHVAPFLLRRLKKDVASQLPQKTEQVSLQGTAVWTKPWLLPF